MAKILLIEPDRILAQNISKFLENQGHKIKWQPTAQAAINSADKSKPEVILLELQLSSNSGLEFLHEFRSYPDWQTVPVIVMGTLHPKDVETSRGLFHDLGVAAYYHKSSHDLSRLIQLVQQSLETEPS